MYLVAIEESVSCITNYPGKHSSACAIAIINIHIYYIVKHI